MIRRRFIDGLGAMSRSKYVIDKMSNVCYCIIINAEGKNHISRKLMPEQMAEEDCDKTDTISTERTRDPCLLG